MAEVNFDWWLIDKVGCYGVECSREFRTTIARMSRLINCDGTSSPDVKYDNFGFRL